MGQKVFDLFQAAAFDQKAVKLLCVAYERARKSLHDTGQPDIVN